VGSVFPDLEIPIILVVFGSRVPSHLVLHSVVGALTLGTAVSVVFTIVLYPYLMSWLFNMDRDTVKRVCATSPSLVVSCLVGNLSHILLDLINHPSTSILWPITPVIVNPICLSLGGPRTTSMIVHLTLLITFVLIVVSQRKQLWERLLIGA
jgi:hypothetical protein